MKKIKSKGLETRASRVLPNQIYYAIGLLLLWLLVYIATHFDIKNWF